MNPLLLMSATRLAGLIRRREVTSSEVVETHMARIREVNGVINAVVQERFHEARLEAKAADALVKSQGPLKLPPFHGVPCTIKECFALRGMPNTSGLVARKGVTADSNAPAVARLLGAGAIPMGVTNISELCMWMESNNNVYGRTNNPYDRRRIAGGSSGGEGAVIGAGGSPFGLGSDIGGSIRGPAFFNGVFGHKPTGGLVPNTGQWPVSDGEAARYVTTGPLARRAEDLWPLVKILAGPDGQDGACRPIELGDPAGVDIAGLTVLDVEDNGVMDVRKDLRAAQRRAASALIERGAGVARIKIEGLKDSLYIWSAMLSAGSRTPFRKFMGNGRLVNPFFHLLAWIVGLSPHTLPAIGLGILEYFPDLLASKTGHYVGRGLALRKELTDLIGERGVLLFPTYVSPAPVHNKPLLPPFYWVYTAIFNVMEFPSTQVPLGLNSEGIPLGVQVVGTPGNDHITVAVAMELEKAFGGWVPPPGLESAV